MEDHRRSMKDKVGLKRSRKVIDGHGRLYPNNFKSEEFDLGVVGYVPMIRMSV